MVFKLTCIKCAIGGVYQTRLHYKTVLFKKFTRKLVVMLCRIFICLTISLYFTWCHPQNYQRENYILPVEDSDQFNIFESSDLENKFRQKRQNEKNSTTEGPSIKDLEESFGGNSHSVDVKQDTTTTPRTGFYFLVDWNSFLDLDNMDEEPNRRRVNIQFRPKAGNPRDFLSVTVP